MTKGKKFDQGKHKTSLLGGVWKPLLATVRVLEFGEHKYGRDNWQLVRDDDGSSPMQRYADALQRHVGAFLEDFSACDAESGLHHLAHATCCCLFLLWFVADENGKPRP